MPSRSAHKAALRRAKEPTVIAPPGVELPALSSPFGWRNPVHDYSFDRDEWQVYREHPEQAITVARVRRLPDGAFSVCLGRGAGESVLTIEGAADALGMAAEWAQRSP
jgi:hypothetical protein